MHNSPHYAFANLELRLFFRILPKILLLPALLFPYWIQQTGLHRTTLPAMTMYHYFHVQAEFYRQQKPQPVYLLLVSSSQIHYKTNRKFYLPEYPFSETTFLLQSVSIPHNALCHIYLSRTEAQPEQYFEYELQTQPIYHSYSLSPLQIPIY